MMFSRVLLLGGTSEIGLEILAALGLPAGAEVLLAGRDEQRMAAAGKELGCQVRTLPFEATALDSHQDLIDAAFADGPVDLVISAAGILTPQQQLDHDPVAAGRLVETNFTGHVSTLLAAVARLRAQGPTSGTARTRPAGTRSPAGWPTRCTAPAYTCSSSGPGSSPAG